MPTLKEKTASGLIWSALNSGLMQLCNALIGVVLARLLLPSDYGLVGMLGIFSAIAVTLQESGFTAALTNKDEPTDRDYNAVFWFTLLASLLLYILLFFSAPLIAHFYHQPRLVVLARVNFLCIVASAIGTVPQAYLYKYMVIRETTLLRVGVLILSGMVGISMAIAGKAYWSLVAQQLCYVTLLSLGKFWLTPWRPSLNWNMQPIREMIGFSSKILFTNIIGQVNQNVLTMIFGRLFPVGLVGHFTQAWKWNGMAQSTICGTLSQVAQPVFASMQHDNKARQLAVLRKMTRLSAFLAFPLMLGLALVAHEFILLLLSERWLHSAQLLQILCLGAAPLAVTLPMQQFIVAKKRSDFYLWANVGQMGLQLVLVLLLSSYGLEWILSGFSAFQFLWMAVWVAFARRVGGYRYRDFLADVLPFLLATIVSLALAGGAATLFHHLAVKMVIKVGVAAIAYFLIMRLSRAVILDECLHYLRHRKVK